MSDPIKVTLEADTRGRISINEFDARGCGSGERIAGPKYNYGGGEQVANVELGVREVIGIRPYLQIADDLHAPWLPMAVRVLSRALDKYARGMAAVNGHGYLVFHPEEFLRQAAAELRVALAGVDVCDLVPADPDEDADLDGAS